MCAYVCIVSSPFVKMQVNLVGGDQLNMEFTILKSSSEKARSKGNGSGSNRGMPIHYSSKSLERPKKAKGNHEVRMHERVR